jgi:hypothetical protein
MSMKAPRNCCSRSACAPLDRSERQSETDWTRLSSNGELVEDDQLSRPYQVSLGALLTRLVGWLWFVHGRPYASDMLLSSVEVGVKEDIAMQRVMGSVGGILWAMSCADMMLSRALQLYHTRGAARLAIDLFGPLSTILLLR